MADHPAYVVLVRHVGPERESATRGAFDESRGFASAVFIDVGHRDRGAVTRQTQRGGLADSRARARDEGDRAGDVHRDYSIT